jgi:branched-chain amino acid transport system ATP-binding protein
MLAELIFNRIEEIHRQAGLTVLLVEQRVAEALGACNYGYVLESGHLVLQGTHDALLADERVKRAYLGM